MVVIELLMNRPKCSLHIGEVHDPTRLRIDRAADVNLASKGMTMKSPTLVAGGHVREPVCRLKRELLEDLHHGIPRSLWVCTLSRQLGWARQYRTARSVFCFFSKPSIG